MKHKRAGKVLPLTALSQTRLSQVPHLNLTHLLAWRIYSPTTNTQNDTSKHQTRGFDMKDNIRARSSRSLVGGMYFRCSKSILVDANATHAMRTMTILHKKPTLTPVARFELRISALKPRAHLISKLPPPDRVAIQCSFHGLSGKANTKTLQRTTIVCRSFLQELFHEVAQHVVADAWLGKDRARLQAVPRAPEHRIGAA